MSPSAIDQQVLSLKGAPSVAYHRPSSAQAAADCIPVLVDDEYHVFHLTTPNNTTFHPPRLRSTWSHIRSRDLVRWSRHDEPALEPGNSQDDPDADGSWTGAALLGPDECMHLFFTGYNLSRGGQQTIIHARSNDRHGTSFTKAAATIPIAGNSRYEEIDFRDPYVFWNTAESKYWMLVATRLAQGPHWTKGCIALLTSDDLEEWSIEDEPLIAPNDVFCPECPEMFQLPNGKWYLVYSRFSGPNAGTIWKSADSPRGPFRTPRDGSGGRFDGRRWYAAKSCPKAGDPSRRIFFGWTGDQTDQEKWLWGGDLTQPREVYANASGALQIKSVDIVVKQSYSVPMAQVPPQLQLQQSGTRASTEIKVPEDLSAYLLQFSVVDNDAASFGVNLGMNKDGKGLALRFSPKAGDMVAVALTRYPVPLDDFWADQYDLYLPREVDGLDSVTHDVKLDGPVQLFVRGECIEVFVGGKALSYRYRKPKVNGEYHRPVSKLAFFVEDGQVSFDGIMLRNSMA